MRKRNDELTLEDLGVRYFTEISDTQIKNAVVDFVGTLDLGSGSTTAFHVYKLMQAYLKNKEKRLAINEILHTPDNDICVR